MKQLTVILALALLAACAQRDGGTGAKMMADSTNYTTIQWLDSIVDFDSLTMGKQLKLSFRFRNTGTKPLFLADVTAGCGCTVADYTRGAIAPGKEGEVTGAFDSNKSHPGLVRKSIFVTANTKNGAKHTLIFTGIIKEKRPNS